MIQQGLSFFPLNTVLDDKIRLIEAEFGLKGFAIVVKLLQKIYRDEGYYCEWNDDVGLLFSQAVGQSINLVSEIVSACVRRGLFDKNKFDDYGVLTSAGIQKRFFSSSSRRKSVEVIKDYLLVDSTQIPENVNILSGNVNKNEKNVDTKKQKKERNKKKEIEGEEAPGKPELSAAAAELITFYQKNMAIPITPMTMEKLLAWMNDVDVSLIEYAIEQAVGQNKRNWAYIEAILNNHANAGRKTRAEAEGSKSAKGESNAKPTKFSNFSSTHEYDFDLWEKRLGLKSGKAGEGMK